MTSQANQTFVAAIAAKYGKRLRRFLSVRLRNAADAPDLAQEVFLHLLRTDRYEAIRSPEAYCADGDDNDIARNLAPGDQQPWRRKELRRLRRASSAGSTD